MACSPKTSCWAFLARLDVSWESLTEDEQRAVVETFTTAVKVEMCRTLCIADQRGGEWNSEKALNRMVGNFLDDSRDHEACDASKGLLAVFKSHP